MLENSPQGKKESTEAPLPASEQNIYHWNYAAQLAYDSALEKKQRRRGGAVYAIIMAFAFLACIALLVGVLIWYQNTPTASNGVNHGSASIGAVADTVKPATVLIYTQTASGNGYGTGFFLRDDGYIATNFHVVEGASLIKVRLYNGRELNAELVNGSAPDDLAVIKVKGAGYPVVKIGDSDRIRVGDTAIAIGNPGGAEAPWTTTSGIISATDRWVSVSGSNYLAQIKMLQTDAPLNSGNSGGPLCNANGEVIGIVSRKLSDREGIGFAIPINEAIASLSAMIDGTYKQENSTVTKLSPSLGISASNISAGASFMHQNKTYTTPYDGVYVAGVVKGSGSEGKLQPGDVIYAIDGHTDLDVNTLRVILNTHSVGDTVTLSVYRLGQKLEVQVTLSVAK